MTVSRIVALLKARFGSENQAERFRVELRSRKRNKGESLQKLYQGVCRLMSLMDPGESSALSGIVGHDAFLGALHDQVLRVRILKKEPRILDDALNLASRLDAFDIMGSTGPEADIGTSRSVRAATGGGKELTFLGVKDVSRDLKTAGGPKGLECSYRQYLDKHKQRLQIDGLTRNYQPPRQGN